MDDYFIKQGGTAEFTSSVPVFMGRDFFVFRRENYEQSKNPYYQRQSIGNFPMAAAGDKFIR